MAIKISGTTVLDDSKNIVNTNNMTVGVVTMTGSSGDIETPGTIRVGGIDSPLAVSSFSPADGATGIAQNVNIVITFDSVIEKATTGVGTTANITLRQTSSTGTVIDTIGINSTSITTSGAVATIDPPGLLPPADVYVVVDAGAFVKSNIGSASEAINTYNFTVPVPALGAAYEGGFLICCQSGVRRWVVAPVGSEVVRNFANIGDSVTKAVADTGVTGWFMPTAAQMQNPGYQCRQYWDAYKTNTHRYWTSNTDTYINMEDGSTGGTSANLSYSVRAFRCISY